MNTNTAFSELINGRYSCKKFSPQPVGREQLNFILEAGRAAPTARNNQPQRIYVVESPEGLAKIDGLTPCRYGAGTVLIVAYDSGNIYTYPGDKYDSGVEDAAIVATHMMLAAKAAGVESCWLNRFDPDEAAAAFALPENERVVLLMDLGYPAPEAGPLPNHSKRRPMDETVTFL